MRRLFLAPLVALPSFSAVADTDTSDQVERPTIVISASRIEQPVSTVGSSVTVLAADELKERGISFVADAFREVPSLAVSSSGGHGSKTQIRIRGNEANHVLVLVDGMRVSNASDGEFDFANMHLDGIERIEVLLGPQSTLYGSDAAAGVINIITSKGEGAFGGQVHAAAGSLNTRSGSVQVSGGEQGWHYSVSANRYLTDGISAAAEKNGNTEKDGHDSKGLKVKTGYDADTFSTWISYNQSRSDYDFDSDDDFATGQAYDEADNHQTVDTDAASWGIAFSLLDGRLNNQVQLSRSQYDYNSYSIFFGMGSNYRTETDRESIEYQGSYQIDDSHSLQFGMDITDDALLVSTFDREATVRGTYLQWSGDFNGTNITLGGRSDDHDEFNRHTTYRATASRQLDNNWRLRAAYGTGFKAPSLQELYDSGFGGNPDLKPEESSSRELGIEYRHDNYYTSATLFNQNTTNLIRSTGTWPNLLLKNLDDADSRGVELNTGISWQQAELTAALTWLDATETENSVESKRQRVPKLAGQVTGSYFYSDGRIWAEAQYQGERRDENWALQQDVTLAAYWLFNLGASYEVSDDLSLSARIDNLLDEEYEEVYSYGTLGRTGTVSLDWRF